MYSKINREIKSKKIEAVLSDFLKTKIKGFKILDLGAGSGLIGNYFAGCNKVYYSDLEDLCGTHTKGDFLKINNNMVPYPDNSFDIIISNMVIEHTANPEKHLIEIYRLLKDGGICYLGAPNAIFPWEPHYKLPFIHYLPHRIEILVIRLLSKVIHFKCPIEDVYLTSYLKLKKMLKRYFKIYEYTAQVLKNPERYYLPYTFFKKLNYSFLQAVVFLSPTNIFVLTKK